MCAIDEKQHKGNSRFRFDGGSVSSCRAKAVFFLAAFMVAAVAAGDVFYWIGDGCGEKTWGAFGDHKNWLVGTNHVDCTNPQGLVPGADDEIFIGEHGESPYYARWFFDLGGATRTVKCINSPHLDWKRRYMSVTNGTLEFAGSFTNRRFEVKIFDDGKLKVGDGAVSLLGDSGTRSAIKVYDGGSFELGGDVSFYNYDTEVHPGGSFTLDTSRFVFSVNNNNSDAHAGQGIFNEGTTDFPGGVILAGTARWADPTVFHIRQAAGTMTLGGDIRRDRGTSGRGELKFSLAGGVLKATDDVSFIGLLSASTDPDTFAELCVTDDHTLDISPFSFGENTSLVKTGSGRLKTASLPATLSVESGTLCPLVSCSLSDVSFSPGTTLEFCVSGFEIQRLPNVAEMNFKVDTGNLGPGVTLVRSDDGDLLEAIAERLSPALPAGLRTHVEPGALKLAMDASNPFSSDGELDLSSVSGWKEQVVPSGADVFVVGGSTVALIGPDTPAFKSITLTDGAVLKVAPGTVLPKITTIYSAKVVFEAGAESVFTNGYDSRATGNELPVIEIRTNAAVNVGRGFVFRNVDLHLYGTVSATNQVVFGGAAADETAYFAMTSDGGSIELRGKGGSYRRFVSPEQGGRVEVVRDILIRDTRMLPDNDGYWGSGKEYASLQIGYQNPIDIPFEVVVDGCFLDIGYEPNSISGGATVKCVNGGGLYKPRGYAHPGFHAQTQIYGMGRVVLEDGSYLRFSKSNARTDSILVRCLAFNPHNEGTEQLVLRGGSRYCVHQQYGNGKAIAVFEDSYCDIPTLMETNKDFTAVSDTREWLTDVFNGMHSVRIVDGSSLYLRATNDLWGLEWDRDVRLADVPLTGGGSLVVTNAASGNPFRATVVCGSNTATGIATAYPDVGGDDSALLFNDGANWAGTVAANGHVALTNVLDGSAARVSFNALTLDGDFPVRVWEDANDMVDLAAASLTGPGRIRPVAMGGRTFIPGDTFPFGKYPAGAEYPVRTGKDWVLFATETDDPDVVLLNLRYSPRGLVLSFR